MTKNIVIVALVALVVGLGAGIWFSVPGESNVGGLSERDVEAVSLKLGSTGTKLSLAKVANASSCTASSSIAIASATTLECAVSGVLSTDTILMSPGAAAASTHIRVTGVFASSTANGYVEYIVSNASTTAAVTSNQTDVRNVDLLILR